VTRTEAAQILGVAVNADRRTARAAYRRLAREHHPDAGGDAERFHAVTLAWQSWGSTAAPNPSPATPQAEVDDDEVGPDTFGDDPISAARPSAALTALPAFLTGFGILTFVGGTFVGATPLLAAGLIVGMAGLASFALVPFWVMTRGGRRRRPE
jgi:hypothetical protein